MIKSAVNGLGYTCLKAEQQSIISSFVRGNDVFGVLPTGFGKSLCYTCLPMVFDDRLFSGSSSADSVIVVVTPLTALIKRLYLNKQKIVVSIVSNTCMFSELLMVSAPPI